MLDIIRYGANRELISKDQGGSGRLLDQQTSQQNRPPPSIPHERNRGTLAAKCSRTDWLYSIERCLSSMTKLKIFVGSSKEQKDVAQSCAAFIESAGHTALCWWESEVIPPGQPLFPVLRQIARQVDGAVFVFGEDDKVWFDGQLRGQPRDNVLIEYGLFVGSSPDKSDGHVIFCRTGEAKTASDLDGITSIPYLPGQKNKFEQAINLWLNKLRPSSSGDSTASSHVFLEPNKRSAVSRGRIFDQRWGQ